MHIVLTPCSKFISVCTVTCSIMLFVFECSHGDDFFPICSFSFITLLSAFHLCNNSVNCSPLRISQRPRCCYIFFSFILSWQMREKSFYLCHFENYDGAKFCMFIRCGTERFLSLKDFSIYLSYFFLLAVLE